MAKRRRRRDHSIPDPVANLRLSDFTRPGLSPLNLIEDRRLYHPEYPNDPVRTTAGGVSHITTETNVNVGRPGKRKTNLDRGTKSRLVFSTDEVGSRAIHCVRRETRREVIFAKGKGGSRHRRKVRRNTRSQYGCD